METEHTPAVADQPTRAVQDYLKAIHLLGGSDRTVSPAVDFGTLEATEAVELSTFAPGQSWGASQVVHSCV